MKMFNVESSIIFRCEEILNLKDEKGKKLDKVVSGRVIRETITFLGFKLRKKYKTEYCYPQIDFNDVHQRSAYDKVKASVLEKCENKAADYYNNGI